MGVAHGFRMKSKAILVEPPGHAFEEHAELFQTSDAQVAGSWRQRGNISGAEYMAMLRAEVDLHSEMNSSAFVEVDTASGMKSQPLIVNRCKMPLVVYLERGFLFNKQVILPGEAVELWTPMWGPSFLPYSIVVLVGDEAAIPSNFDSLLHFVGVSAVPAAFVGGVVVSVVSWGALSGPSLALAPLVSPLPHVAGYTLAAVDIAAGIAAAGGAEAVSDRLIAKYPKAFMTKQRHVFPGTKYFAVHGGPDGTRTQDLHLREVSQGELMTYDVSTVKVAESLRSVGHMATAAFTIERCGDARAIGRWRRAGDHSGRPKYELMADRNRFEIEWSASRRVWRMFNDDTLFGHGRKTLYQSNINSGIVPESGWEAVEGGLPLPDVALIMATEDGDDEL